jgi:predicted DNA-binding antitoxin AbrB/MazE fold protein
MSQNIQAIYENGILRPLQTLNLPENKIVEIDVRDISKDDSDKGKLIEADLAELSADELKHLEEEFEGYEQFYPRR